MDIRIDEVIDKDLYYKKLTNDKVINITGEGGSGKSTLANEYRKDENYLVVDYDMVLLNPEVGTIEYELKQMLIEKYGNSLFGNIREVGIDKVKENFTIMYTEIINYLSEIEKTIVLDGTQLRFINDAKIIKGEFVALRPSIQTCVSQSVQRFVQNNPQVTIEQVKEYTQKRTDILHQLNPMMNELLAQVDMLPDIKNPDISFDNIAIQNYLQETAKKYLTIIKNEYGAYMSMEQIEFLNQLMTIDCLTVDIDGKELLLNQTNDINSDPNMTTFEKLEELRKLDIPLAHGGRVFEDKKVHFYPSVLLSKNPNLSTDELKQECDEVLIHELLHFFIKPECLDIANMPELKKINSFTTEGLVDMCARDTQQKYGLFPKYQSNYGPNVILAREMLSNIPNVSERMQLVFNGSIEQIYQKTSTQTYNSRQEFINTRDKKTKYDEVIAYISRTCYSEEEEIKNFQRNLYSFSANFKSKSESIEAVEKVIQYQFEDKLSLVKQQIMDYKNDIESKILQDNEELIQKQPFDQRSDIELDIAEEIRIKNQTIAEQKNQQKQSEKPKILVKTNSNSLTSSNGYVNVVILSLILSFIAGMLTIALYLIMR